MNAEHNQRKTDKGLLKYGSLVLATVIASTGVVASYAVNSHRIDVIEEHEKEFVTNEVLELQLEPIKEDVKETKDSVIQMQKIQWQILMELKEQGRSKSQ